MSKGVSAGEFDAKYDIIDAPTPRHTALSGRYKRLVSRCFVFNLFPINL